MTPRSTENIKAVWDTGRCSGKFFNKTTTRALMIKTIKILIRTRIKACKPLSFL